MVLAAMTSVYRRAKCGATCLAGKLLVNMTLRESIAGQSSIGNWRRVLLNQKSFSD
jgi:hypothetical protein